MRIHQVALEAAHTPVSRENLESTKRCAAAMVEWLNQAIREESRLPSLSSLSLCDQYTPPSSPISVSPSSSPRVSQRMKDSVDDEPRMHLPPINPHPNHIHIQPHAYPLSSQSTKRMSNGFAVTSHRKDDTRPLNLSGGYSQFSTSPESPTPAATAFTQFTASSYPPRSHTTFITHSFDKSNSHSQDPQPMHLAQPNQPIPIPRPAGAPSTGSMAIVITQPIATICEVPGFKRRGRPSTRIDNQCVECGTHRTPEWRRGEGGVHLCNACGLQYSKRVRREKAEKRRNAITAVLNPHNTDVHA